MHGNGRHTTGTRLTFVFCICSRGSTSYTQIPDLRNWISHLADMPSFY